MKFQIKRQPFMNRLADVMRAVPSKATIPVLTGIKLTATEDGLTLIGSDADISIESFLPSQDDALGLSIEETGSVVVASRLFNDIIRKLPLDTVTIDVDENNQVAITSGNAFFTLNGLEGSAYPHLPEINSEQRIELPTLLFKSMINQTIFSASNQESHPVLTGLHLTMGDGFISGVATDSHRLSRREFPIEIKPEQLNFDSLTIPKKTVQELERIVEDDEELSMIVSDKQVIFFIENVTIYSRLSEGNYPETDRLIPTDYETRLVVSSNEFLQAIDRASLMSHQGKNNVVQLSYSEAEGVTLAVRGNERGQASEDIVTEAVEGEAVEISFNPDYMKDALSAFNGVDINLDIQSAVRPTLLTPVEKSELPNNEVLQLLTPIRTH